MAELSALQRQMAELLRGERALEKSSEATAFAEREIGGNSRLSPVEQLEIYREQFWLRHTSALLEDFPGLSGIIGQAAWERLVEQYFRESPSASYSLRDLGDELVQCVRRATWLEHHELCLDMARLEWAYVEAFDAADVALLAPEKLGDVPDDAWERARLVLGPSLSLLTVSYPVAELRKRLVKDGDESVGIPERAPARLCVCRRELAVKTHELELGAYALLDELRAGLGVVPAVEAAAAKLGIEADALVPELGGWFARWAEQGVVVGVVI